LTTEIRIVLADDHAVLRAGLRLLLDEQLDMKVVGEAADGAEVLELSEALQPDIILLDLTMPRLGGLEALPLLRERAPESRVLVLTMHDDQSYLRQVLKNGAAGYVLKKAADAELITAVQSVMRGDVYVQPSMTRTLLDDMLYESESHVTASDDLWASLSQREQEVLKMVAMGYTGREIGDKLSLSIKTVDTYRARGMGKLGLQSRAALVRFALAQGLMEDSSG